MIESLALFALPLRRCSIHCDHEVLTRLISGSLYCLQDGLDGLIVAGQVRCKAAFVADGSSQTLCLQNLCQAVEYFCTPAERFLKAGCANRHDHEFLGIYGVGSVCAAVQNVHHRNRQTCAGNAAQETIQRNIQCSCCCSCSSDGNCQDRICAQLGLVLCAVCCDHCLVHSVQVRGIHASDSLVNDGVDVFNCLGHALAQITCLVAVTQFQRLEFAGGCAAGCSTSCGSTVNQSHFRLNGRVSSGIQNFSANNLFDLQVIHCYTTPLRTLIL